MGRHSEQKTPPRVHLNKMQITNLCIATSSRWQTKVGKWHSETEIKFYFSHHYIKQYNLFNNSMVHFEWFFKIKIIKLGLPSSINMQGFTKFFIEYSGNNTSRWWPLLSESQLSTNVFLHLGKKGSTLLLTTLVEISMLKQVKWWVICSCSINLKYAVQ